jgi:hypothetical protein
MKLKMSSLAKALAALVVSGLLAAACSAPPGELAATPAPPATVESVATPEPVASSEPTATPAPAATLSATPVPSSTSAPEPAAAQPEAQAGPPPENVLYADDFTRPDSGWPGTTVFDNYYIGYHEPEFYHVEVRVPHDYEVVVLPERTFEDFSAEAQVFPDPANTAPEGDFRYGLAVRRSGKQFYAFTISARTQAWTVLKASPARLEVLAQGSDDSIRGAVGEDTLRVDAQGATFTFWINGRPVSQVSDTDYSAGELGFYVETFDAPRVHVHYDSLTIREAQAGPPPENALYADDFTRPDSGWPGTTVFDNYYIGYHEPEFYHVEVRVPHDYEVVVLPERTFEDFSAEAQVFPDPANTAPEGDFRYGLAVRRSGKQFYAFTISARTQAWTVLKASPARLEVLAQGSDDSIQGEVGEDTLRVDAQGSTFTFWINGRAVSQVSDAAYSAGELGFYVETFDAPRVHVHYDSLTIREVMGLEPSQADVVAGAATPTPGPSPLQCSVVTPMLNLRSGPSTAYAPIGVLSSGTLLEPLGRSPDSLWLEVQVPASGEQGWVAAAAAYISCNLFVNELPVSQPPAR